MDLQEVDTLFEKSSFLDSDKVHKMITHPLHIIDKSGNLSPSAFIPFCKFDKWMGVKIEQFDVPVCDIFQALNSAKLAYLGNNYLRLGPKMLSKCHKNVYKSVIS